MSIKEHSGFTIIETVLFLSVTGLLVMGMLVGVGVSLNNQRYRDAAESFKNILQRQYTDLGSTRNARENNWSCDSSAFSSDDGSTRRGQSDCMIVGKYVRIDRADIQIYTVLAYQASTAVRATDIATLRQNYRYNVAQTEVESRTMDWGVKIGWPVSGSGARPVGTNRTMGLLFIRSPETGNVYTFTGDTVPPTSGISNSTFTTLIVEGGGYPGQGKRTICIAGSGLYTGGDSALQINQYASAASAIELVSNDTMLSTDGAGAPQC